MHMRGEVHMNFSMDHFAISVRDLKESEAFYARLGFAARQKYTAEDGSVSITHLEKDGIILELFCYPDSAPVPAFVNTVAEDLKVQGAKHLGLMTDHLEDARQFVLEEGLTERLPEIRKGRMGRDYFFIQDPSGIQVEFIEAR